MNRRGLLALGIALSLASSVAWGAESSEFLNEAYLEYSFVTEDNHPAELAIWSPRFQGRQLGSVITAYMADNAVFLPLTTIARMLEIGISLGARPGTASGFIISEDRTFTLDFDNRYVSLGGQIVDIDGSQVQIRPDDIYVESSLLSTWLPINFTIDTFAATIDIEPREPVPLQLRLQRERLLAQLSGRGAAVNYYPRLQSDYRLFDGPFLDQTLSFSAGRDYRAGTNDLSANSTSYLAADLLYLETNGYLSANTLTGIADYRVTAGRRDYYGRMLGPLQAKELLGGHIYFDTSALVAHSSMLRGATISNYALGRVNEPEGHTFRGDLPPGWVVELYRQDILLDYRRADPTGIYVFDNVPLQLGVNEFKLVFYGPYGQRRTETYTYNIADLIAAPGEFNYRLTAGENFQDQLHAGLKTEYGLMKNLAITSAFNHLTVLDRRRQYVSGGFRTFVDRFYGHGDIAYETSGHKSLQGGLKTRLGGATLHARYTGLDRGYESQVFWPTQVQIRQILAGGADYQLSITNTVPLNVGAVAESLRYWNGDRVTRLAGRAGTVVEQLAITNTLNWYSGDRAAFRYFSSDGILHLSRNVDPAGRLRASAEFSYYLRPQAEPRGFGVFATTELPAHIFGTAGFAREFRGESRTEIGVAKVFEAVSASITGRHHHGRGVEAFLQLSFGAGYVRPQRTLQVEPRPMGTSGAILARVFLDRNNNGRWDAGEPAIPEANVFVNGMNYQQTTGRDGTVFVSGLMPHSPLDLSLDPTFEDPAWMSMQGGISVVARPGRTKVVDFPVIPTGEIEGTIFYTTASGLQREAAGMIVELVDSRGQVARTTTTAYDGYYYFDKVVPGTYTVRLSAGQLARIGFVDAEHKAVRISQDGSSHYGLDFTLQRVPVPVSAP